ncbi:hypothetical protein MMC31_008258 [Peltigera leucophlebia]|nr:hypothetical protein [Peltigera leucophlebia]
MSYDYSWMTVDRHYSLDYETFTKRELFPHERKTNWKGEIIRMPWSTARLENEYAALEYIAANTEIPVPEVLSFEKIDGSYHLVVERLWATPLSQLEENRAEALENTKTFINTVVLPQLAQLRSNKLGNLNGVVIPPDRITNKDPRPWWPPQTSSTDEFVFCHNDLAQHNILVDPDTLQVDAIIDWEYSGFYPPEFEAPLWTKSCRESDYHDIDAEKIESLTKFLDKTPGMHQQAGI